MIFDYLTLKIIWWLLVGVLFIGFALTAGFDLGVGSLLPWVGKKDEERRVLINAIGPTWEGNQVWLILGAGAVFAAWPLVYAAAFSMFYGVLLIALFALIVRPAGFVYRSKLTHPTWRSTWDWIIFAGSAIPAVIFGAAFGNLLLGVPFHYDDTLRAFYLGTFSGIFSPFALLAGVVSFAVLVMHGGVFLQLRTEGEIRARSRTAVMWFGAIFLIAFIIAGFWVAFGVDGYRIVAMPDPNTAFTPLEKTVQKISGAWLDNYNLHPWMMAAPALAVFGAAATLFCSAMHRPGIAFYASSATLTGVVLTAGFAMFPFFMPSSSHPNHGITVWDGASSHLTLIWMFWATVLFMPLIIGYTTWVFRVMRGTVTVKQIKRDEHTAY
jgi:cytochrome d ubiquinol oxidase subunit II